jgi:uncharacterized membrane protein
LFDTFTGLPLHILVVHFVVVLVPISAFATIGVFVWPAWRRKYGAWIAALNVMMLVLTFVTVRAGLDLKDRYRALGDTQTPGYHHEGLGKSLLWVVLALAVLSAAAWWVGRMPNMAPVAIGLGAVVALVAIGAIVLTTLTGDSGARTTWSDFIKSSDKATSSKN